jgi:hypothetical protein
METAMPTDPAEPALTRHPPEHGSAGAPETLPAGCCCCCCCCCCLHTLGGIGGAVLGSTLPMQRRPVYESDPDSPFPYRRDVFEEDQPIIPPVLLYWLMVALTVVLTVAATPFLFTGPGGPSNPLDAVPIGLFIALMILPGLQLIASLFAVLAVAIFYPERNYALRRLGKITLWSFAGTSLGLLLMGGCVAVIFLAK